MKPLRAIIIDDEPLARQHLHSLLAGQEGIEVLGEAGDGAQAIAEIVRLQPELVFLDIQMPDLDGFELLRRIGRSGFPIVIFTTAYDEYALRAFESEAVDYLLKPVDSGRLSDAVRKAKLLAAGLSGNDESHRILQAAKPVSYRSRIAARSGTRTVLLQVDDIDWIEPVSNYAKIRVGSHAYYLRSTMRALEQELDPRRFVRIHRGAIVNVDRIAEVAKAVNLKDYVVVLKNGQRLEMHRAFAGKLRTLVGRF